MPRGICIRIWTAEFDGTAFSLGVCHGLSGNDGLRVSRPCPALNGQLRWGEEKTTFLAQVIHLNYQVAPDTILLRMRGAIREGDVSG